MKRNDLAGRWVRVIDGPHKTPLAQVLNHPADDGKYYLAAPGFGAHFTRDQFELTDTPAELPRWAYPAWHPLAGGSEADRPKPEYGPNWSHEVADDTWYFNLAENGEVCRTVELKGERTVNIDYGHGGAIVGVEVV